MIRVVHEVEQAVSPFASYGLALSREWFAGALQSLRDAHALGLLHIHRLPRPKWVVSFAPLEELPTASAPSEVAEARRFLELDHRYHDDSPVVGASFKVLFEDGSEIEGTLDGTGKARIEMSARPIQVQYGPDARPWTARKQIPNPKYRASLSDAEIDALVQSRFGRA